MCEVCREVFNKNREIINRLKQIEKYLVHIAIDVDEIRENTYGEEEENWWVKKRRKAERGSEEEHEPEMSDL